MPPLNRVLICTALLAAGVSSAVPAQSSPAPLDSAAVHAWREDLALVARELPKRHANLFPSMPRAQFDSALASLDRRLPSLARHQVILELARIVALVGDGHTNVAPTRDSAIAFHTLPVTFHLFRDGLFVRAADSAHADLVGGRVLRIGRATPEQAYAQARLLVGRDNEMDARFFVPFLLAMPEVLHGLGLADDLNEVPLSVERDGRRVTLMLRPSGPARLMLADTDDSWAPDSGWVDLRDEAARRTPLWLSRDPRTEHWFTWLSDTRTVYVQYNKVADAKDETVAAFAGRLLAFVDSAPVRRLVLDLRLNRGGNGDLNRPLLLGLIRSRKLDAPGRLFVLIGRSTFSAAQFLVNDLERYTRATFIGEPTGGKPNSYGDSRKLTLPNSGVTVRASIYWWQTDPRDHRPWIAPSVAAELSSAEYAANRDPAMEAVFAWKPEPPLDDRMREAYAAGDAARALREYRSFLADPRHRWADLEVSINNLAYELLGQEKFEPAVALFEANARQYPGSSNAFDSLGEAYLRAGRRAEAIRSYTRAVALDPTSATAAEALTRLRGPRGRSGASTAAPPR